MINFFLYFNNLYKNEMFFINKRWDIFFFTCAKVALHFSDVIYVLVTFHCNVTASWVRQVKGHHIIPLLLLFSFTPLLAAISCAAFSYFSSFRRFSWPHFLFLIFSFSLKSCAPNRRGTDFMRNHILLKSDNSIDQRRKYLPAFAFTLNFPQFSCFLPLTFVDVYMFSLHYKGFLREILYLIIG